MEALPSNVIDGLAAACERYNTNSFRGYIQRTPAGYVYSQSVPNESGKAVKLFDQMLQDCGNTQISAKNKGTILKAVESIKSKYADELDAKQGSRLGAIELLFAYGLAWCFPCCMSSPDKPKNDALLLKSMLSPLASAPLAAPANAKVKGDNHRMIFDPAVIRGKLETTLTAANKGLDLKNKPQAVFAPDTATVTNTAVTQRLVKIDEIDVLSVYLKAHKKDREDVEFADSIVVEINRQRRQFKIAGVCDGHFKEHAAKYVAGRIREALIKQLQDMDRLLDREHSQLKGEDRDLVLIWNALKLTPVALHEAYNTQFQNSRDMSGTTLTLALIEGNDVWTANTGDSGAVMLSNRGAVRLSEEARKDFTNMRMVQPMNDRGAEIDPVNPFYPLGTLRFLGNKEATGNDPRPKITRVKLEGPIIIASDGLWDVCSPVELHRFAAGKNIVETASQAVAQARRAKSTDDITVVALNRSS